MRIAIGMLGCCLWAAGLSAAEAAHDVDVTLKNTSDGDFRNLPVFLTVSQVFGRGIHFDRLAPEGFRVYDDQGAELDVQYRVMPPAFSMAADELIIVLPSLAKGAEAKLRFTNTPGKSARQRPFDLQAALDSPGNLVPNGGFEKGADGWEGGRIVNDVVHSGSSALLLEAPAKGGKDSARSAAKLSFVKDRPYYFSVWARSRNVVRHSYRWPEAGGKIILSNSPLALSTNFDDKAVRHERVMDDRDWYPYHPAAPGAIKTAESELSVTLNQVWKAFVDPDRPARVWIDDVLVFPQPEVTVNWDRAARAQTPGETFVYRRAATCSGSTFGPVAAPRPYEKIDAVEDAAALGERKCLTLGLFSTKAIADLALDLSDLVGPDGRKLAKQDFEVEFNFNPAADWKLTPTSLEGWCIDGNVPRSTDRAGWVDWFIGIRVPGDAAPGVYAGTVKIQGGGKDLATVPVKLEVVNLPLAIITDRFMGEIYNNGCGPDSKTGAVLPARDSRYYRYYSRCNYTMMMMFSHFLPFVGGGPEVDLTKLVAQMKEMRDVAGCTAGVGLYWDCSLDRQGGRAEGGSGLWSRCGKAPDKYRAAVKKINDALTEAKCPPLVYMVWDEPRFFDQRLQILKGTGALTTADIFANEMIAAMQDRCLTHTSCDDPSMEPGPMTYKWAAKLGIRWGMAGWPTQQCNRYQTGMLYAASGMNYWHHWYGNQFIGYHNAHKAFVRGANIVGNGEGMIDLRYFETLRNAIAEAKRRNVAARETAAAEAYLKSVFDYCTGDWYWVGVYNGTPEEWGDDWFYDGWRSRMRRLAVAINAQLPKD